jgi:class 3 adenylate cyclase/DNA-binding SARP family transcriptional activator/tetratricopeptide (TPR) repeat protein
VDIRILGPVEASADGRPLALGGAKQRAVLALLALRAGRVVPTDELIDELWGEHAPRTADHSVQVYVSELRKLLAPAGNGSALLARRPPGYVLDVDPQMVDAHRFERETARGRALVAAGEALPAAEALRAALAMWRGRPLGGLDGTAARAEVERLEELRLTAVEDALDADLALGRAAEAVAELRLLVAEHQTRDRLRELLVLALYRTGRQSDALEELAVARSTLAEELGVDPGPALRRLEEAILRQDPSLDAPAASVPASPPTPPTPATAADRSAGSDAASVSTDAPAELRKIVTVLFTDVSGSTALGERLDAESLRGVMTRFFDAMRSVLERHGATIEKYIGDAIMAVFGVPSVREDDALRAVRAAVEMRDELRELNATLMRERGVTVRARTGLNTGEVVAGAGDVGERLVTGDAVNVAARLEQAAEPDEIVLGATTYRLVRDAVVVDIPSHLDVRGKSEPVTAYRLLEVRAGAPGVSRALDSELVGREAELGLLRDALRRASASSECGLVTVFGDAGVGKSRLVEELTRTAGRDVTVLKGRCLSYGEGITFWPVVEAVRQAASIHDDDDRDAARAKLDAAVDGMVDGPAIAQAFAQMMGLTDADVGAGATLRAARRFLEALSAARPVVFVIEDIHWAEPTLLDLIESVAEWSRDFAILLICTARPEFLESRPGWGGGHLNAQSLSLRPLSADETSVLVRNLLGGATLTGEAVDAIVSTTEGNALFVEQTLSMLIDEGRLLRGDEGWVAIGDLQQTAMPTEIRTLLSARIDLLSSPERRVLERASAIGRAFDAEAVAELSPAEETSSVREVLDGLARRDLVRRDGESAFRFRHALILNAVYEAIPKRTRAELHERVAEWLERRHGERASEYDEIIGRHLERAVAYLTALGPADEHARSLSLRAGARLIAAGERALARGDMPAVVSLFSGANAILASDDDARVAMLPDLGTALVEIGELARAEETFGEALRVAEERDDLRLRSHALVYLFELVVWRRGRPAAQPLVAEVERLIPIAEDRGDDLVLYRLWRVLSMNAERLLDQKAGSDRAMRYALRAGDRRGQLELLQTLSGALPDLPIPLDDAIASSEEYLATAAGDPLAEAGVRVNARVALLAMADRIEDSRAELAAARTTFTQLGLKLWLAASTTLGEARAESIAGNPVAAEAALRAGIESLRGMSGQGFWVGWELTWLADALARQGKVDEAETALDEAEGIDAHLSAPIVRGRILLARRRWEDAERQLAGALETVDPDMVPYVADAHLLRAIALSRLGLSDEARDEASAALELLEAKRAPALLRSARRILDEL